MITITLLFIIIFQKSDANNINKIKNLELQISKLQTSIYHLTLDIKNPYITIIGYENLENIEDYTNTSTWKTPLYYLFYKTYLPQLWITNSILYNVKNSKTKVVYVYLISNEVKKYVHKKLNEYVKISYPKKNVKILCKSFSE